MKRGLGSIALILAFALGTWVFGWPGVPMVALAHGALAARNRAPLEALGAAVIAWLVLLAMQAARGPAGQVARTLGGVIGAPGWTILILTLLFAAALAWSSAVIGRTVGQLRSRFSSSDSIASRRSS